jgi:hypothetical protein
MAAARADRGFGSAALLRAKVVSRKSLCFLSVAVSVKRSVSLKVGKIDFILE